MELRITITRQDAGRVVLDIRQKVGDKPMRPLVQDLPASVETAEKIVADALGQAFELCR